MAQWVGVEATRRAWSAKAQSASQRLMLLAIAKYADENCKAFPSVDSLCADTCLNKKTAFKVLKELKELGVLSVAKRTTNNANEYTILAADGCTNTGSTKNGTTENGTTSIGTTVVPKTERPVVPKTVHEQNKEESKEENISTCPAFAEAVEDFGLDGFCLQPESKPEPVKAVKAEKKAKKSVRSLVKPADCSQEVFDEWVAYKDSLKGKSKCSQRMVNFIVKEAQTARITSERAMVICMEHGWISFEARFFKGSELEPAVNPFLVTPEQKQSIFAARQYREQSQPEFRNIKANKAPFDDEFDAGAVDLLKGVM